MTEVATTQTPSAAPRASILAKMAGKYGVEPTRLLDTLKATAFKGGVTNEQMVALLIVADQYGLNPFTRELYGFPDKGGVVPVVGVDGWARIMNEHPMFDGIEFASDEASCTATIYRKDRSHPIRITEYLSECKRETQPWKSHPQRLLRHKSMIQCARLAFGFAGIYDPDEAERIATDMGAVDELPARGASIDAVRKAAASKRAPEVVDVDTGEIFDLAEAAEMMKACSSRETLAELRDELRSAPQSVQQQLDEAFARRDAELGDA